MNTKLNEFKVLTFDCYGTLIDWETGIWDAFQPLISFNRRDDIRREQLLSAFGTFESRQQSENPDLAYPGILARVHHACAGHFAMDTAPALDEAFGESVPEWPAFADTADALRLLKSRYRLVILSNVHRAGFAASHRKLGVGLDAVYTAEDIGSYKPAAANFEYLLRHLRDDFGMRTGDVLHTAQSLFHDIAPAQSIGLATAWIDRQGLAGGGEWGATRPVGDLPEPDFRFESMSELAWAVAEASGGA